MSGRGGRGVLSVLCGLLLALLLGVTPAQANRVLVTEKALDLEESPIFEEEIEGACGAAVFGDLLYVSDYYHGSVESFGGEAFPLKSKGIIGTTAPPEGPCEIAFAENGALYANIWHEGVVRLKPSFQPFDYRHSTGVAVDELGKVYVNNRTFVAVYEPSGAAAGTIGATGSLEDAYGLAVGGGRLYVPDAVTETIKVFEPATDPLQPVDQIFPPSGFNSLVDASLALDPTNGHLIVVDNLQPGYEHPKGVIDEFTANGEFLGQLKTTVEDGGPSGVTVDPLGHLYVTNGNSELANVFVFGPYTESGPEGTGAVPEPSVSQAPDFPGPAVSEALPAPVAASTAASKSVNRVRRHRRRRHARRRARPDHVAALHHSGSRP